MAPHRHETDANGDTAPVKEQVPELTNDQWPTSQPVGKTHDEPSELSAKDAALARRLVARHRAVYDYLADR